LGYSNCFIHLGPGLFIIGLIHILSFFDKINIEINWGLKTGIGLIFIGLISSYASYRYRIKMFIKIGSELEDFYRLSEKKEGHLDDYFIPNDIAKEEKTEKDIRKIEKSIKILEQNPSLISKESVDQIKKEKQMKLKELKKSRLEVQLVLYEEIIEMINKIEQHLSDIHFPSQLNSLDKKQSKIIRYIDNIKKLLKSINQQLNNNKFSSEDIPLIYRDLQRCQMVVEYQNDYIDFESYITTVNSRILKVKGKADKNKEKMLIKIENEIDQIKDWYNTYNKNNDKFPDIFYIKKNKDRLQKLEEKLIKKF
jgi:hypothetical protein